MRELPVAAGLEAERELLGRVYAGAAEAGLLLWRPSAAALVMPGKFSRLAPFAAAAALCAARGWPVELRDSGGEPVPQSPAVLNVALVYAAPAAEAESARLELAYQRLCRPLCDWLAANGLEPGLGAVPGAFCDGRYNVTLRQRKLAGTAQRWRRRPGDGRHLVLAHAALLMEAQGEAMAGLVNAFYTACELPQRCRATSHIALGECLAEPWALVAALPGYYRAALADVGLALADDRG